VTSHAEESARRLLSAMIHPEGYTVDVRFARLGPTMRSPAQD
jgi:hypothetical protein